MLHKISICLLFLILPLSAQAKKRTGKYLPVPILTHVAGIGTIYGGGFAALDILGSDLDLVIAKSLGPLEGDILFVNGIHLLPNRLIIGGAQGTVHHIRMTTAYKRGITKDRALIQKARAKGMGGFAKVILWGPHSLNYSYGSGDFAFAGYEELDTASIPLPGASSVGFDLESHTLGLDFNFIDRKKKQGIQWKSSLSRVNYAKTELSSIYIQNHSFKYEQPLFAGLHLSTHIKRSDSSIAKQSITGTSDIADYLTIDCSDPEAAGKEASCSQLREEVIEYTDKHNTYGTASPLGGARSLRSYRENRFRAAHTQFAGVDLQWNVLRQSSWAIQLAIFGGIGWASDIESKLFEKSVNSYGAGLRGLFGPIALRLDGATGDEGEQYHFTVGMPW